MALVAEGQVEEGVAELLRAYEILPHPNVLYNVGRAYAESGRYEQAVDYFQRYLDSDPPDRAEVNGFLQAVQARIAAIAAQSADPEETTEPAEPVAPVVEAVPVASDEEIAALEDSATQIDALAESTQSDALRQRATTLREVAATLRERRTMAAQAAADAAAAASADPVETDPVETDPTEQAATGDTGDALALGEEREGDTYEESVVSSSRAAQSPLDAPNATTIITAQDIRLSGLSANYGETLRRVPGLDLMSNSPGDIQFSIRGLNQRLNNRAIVLVDGRSVYLDFVGGQMWNLIPVNAEDIERIEVVRGPASAVYGADAFTGVVNIITRDLGVGRSYVSSGVGTGGQGRVVAGVSQRVDRVRFRLSGGFETTNQYSRSVSPDRVDIGTYAEDGNLGNRRLMFNGEMQVRLADGYSIRAGTGVVTGSRTFQGLSRIRELNLNEAFFSQTHIQVETAFGLSARVFWNRFSGRHHPTGIGENSLPNSPHVGGENSTTDSNIRRQDVIDAELVYRNNQTIVDGIENQFIAGVGYRFKEVDWTWLLNPATGDTVQTQNHGSIFLQDTLRIDDVVQIVLSARGDLHPLFPEPQFSPRGSVVVHPTERQSIRLSAGTAFRSPTFTESYVNVPNQTPVRGVTAYGIGNPNLNPERIISVELGYMMQESEYFTLELAGYYNLVFDQIIFGTSQSYRVYDHQNDPRAAFNPNLAAYPLGTLSTNNEEADFQQIGGEIGVRLFPVDGLDVYVNYAIHETAVLTDAQTLDGRELDQRTAVHKFNAGIQYRSPFGLDLAVDLHVVGDQVWVEQVLDAERGGTVFLPFELPAYAVMNARIGFRLLDDQVELAVVGTNLLMEHREHPFGQRIDRRFMGHVTLRF